MSMITAEMLWERFLDRDDYDALVSADMETHDADVLAQAALKKAVRDRQDFDSIDESITMYGSAREHFGFVNGVQTAFRHIERIFREVVA